MAEQLELVGALNALAGTDGLGAPGAANAAVTRFAGYPVNATQYNATGDGVTDDTSALQAAIDAAEGRVLWIPRGTYLISAKLTIPSNTVVMGAGWQHTVIKLKNSVNGSFDLLGNEDTGSGNSNISIRDLCVDGNVANNATQVGDGISLYLCTDSEVERCMAKNVGTNVATNGIGINVQGGSRIRIHGCRAKENDRHGIATGATPTEVVVSNCIATDNGADGIHISTGEQVSVTNNACRGNDAAGINMQNASYSTCTGNVCRSNGWGLEASGGYKVFSANMVVTNGYGIKLGATSDSIQLVTVSGNVFRNNTDHTIYCSKVHRLSITGNTVITTTASKDGIKVETLSTGGNPSGRLVITGNSLEVNTGKSINVATDGYDELVITDNYTPQDITVTGTPATVSVRDNIGSTYTAKLDERVAHRTSDATAITSATTGTTLTSDDTLKATLPASTYWEFEATLYLSAANNAMDAKFGWSVPTDATMKWASDSGLANEVASFGARSTSAAVTIQPTLAETDSLAVGTPPNTTFQIKLSGRIAISSTAGVVNFQLAQNTSDAGALTLKAGSSIRFRKL